jgi:ABC-type microcin C transport system permease subunit YejB
MVVSSLFGFEKPQAAIHKTFLTPYVRYDYASFFLPEGALLPVVNPDR